MFHRGNEYSIYVSYTLGSRCYCKDMWKTMNAVKKLLKSYEIGSKKKYIIAPRQWEKNKEKREINRSK